MKINMIFLRSVTNERPFRVRVHSTLWWQREELELKNHGDLDGLCVMDGDGENPEGTGWERRG